MIVSYIGLLGSWRWLWFLEKYKSFSLQLAQMFKICANSHFHTTMWDCCKDDLQSQRKILNFDAATNPLTLKRSSRNLTRVITSINSINKNWAQSVRMSLLKSRSKFKVICFVNESSAMAMTKCKYSRSMSSYTSQVIVAAEFVSEPNQFMLCVFYATADEAVAYMFYRCFFFVFFCFFSVRKNMRTVLGNGWMDFHETFTKW